MSRRKEGLREEGGEIRLNKYLFSATTLNVIFILCF